MKSKNFKRQQKSRRTSQKILQKAKISQKSPKKLGKTQKSQRNFKKRFMKLQNLLCNNDKRHLKKFSTPCDPWSSWSWRAPFYKMLSIRRPGRKREFVFKICFVIQFYSNWTSRKCLWFILKVWEVSFIIFFLKPHNCWL